MKPDIVTQNLLNTNIRWSTRLVYGKVIGTRTKVGEGAARQSYTQGELVVSPAQYHRRQPSLQLIEVMELTKAAKNAAKAAP